MILKLQPVLVDKEVWGGSKIKTHYNYQEASTICGEAWGISGHKTFSSVVETAPYKGKTIRELFQTHKELFGNYEGSEFPILVKIIDAKDNLSIQVHPDDEYAKQFNSLGKEECWYILENEPNTNIIIGHSATTKAELNKSIDEDKIENYINSYPIKKGDFFYIEAGTLHAICGGTTILEVQQSSDITYRVYDYNRKQNDGTYREIHKEQAKEVIKVPDNEVNHTSMNRYFKYDIIDHTDKSDIISHQYGDYIFIIDGEGSFNDVPVQKGTFLMVTSNSRYTVTGSLKYQITTIL